MKEAIGQMLEADMSEHVSEGHADMLARSRGVLLDSSFILRFLQRLLTMNAGSAPVSKDANDTQPSA